MEVVNEGAREIKKNKVTHVPSNKTFDLDEVSFHLIQASNESLAPFVGYRC
jgi:hypothetical protein